VRRQPSHNPVVGLILHTELHGDATAVVDAWDDWESKDIGVVRQEHEFSHMDRVRKFLGNP